MKHITLVAGARPNFMKIAPIIHAINDHNKNGGTLHHSFVHTGQHYDDRMSSVFFEQLNIPKPTINLECGGGTQAEQTASIMIKFEKYLQSNQTDLVLVVGDVTSTMACAIVAQKLGIKVAHVEGGLRSNDWSMPEEINRLVTDAITNYFYTTSVSASTNLLNNGINPSNIFFVGNTMIDTFMANINNFKKPVFWNDYQLTRNAYFVLTLHRPSNVDGTTTLNDIISTICSSAADHKIIFPAHPRTAKALDSINVKYDNLHIVQPLGYLEFCYLVQNSLGVITDSGGVTEEATVMGIPCITLRDTTERPETVTVGTNVLVGTDPKYIKNAITSCAAGQWKASSIPDKWDGQAAVRIVESLSKL
jgi:UDP-N-acetylglucosamine 2-epimerase (non-hydrolysing)